MKIRKASERGHANFGWLDSWHSFSFGEYNDPDHMGFGPLRVINDDTVAGGAGFPTHAHADMEIISYVLDGALQHKDSTGGGSIIRPGEVQRMSAGMGIRHSEFNVSATDSVHFLQIWIMPDTRGIAPSYEQKAFPDAEKRNRFRLVASSDGREGSVRVHQNVSVYASVLDEDARLEYGLADGRIAWLQVARGAISLNGHTLTAGDGAALTEPARVDIGGTASGAEILLFDMAA